MDNLTKHDIMIRGVVEVIEPPIERGVVVRIDERRDKRFVVKWFDEKLGISTVFNGECRLIVAVEKGKVTPLVSFNSLALLTERRIVFRQEESDIYIDDRDIEKALGILFG